MISHVSQFVSDFLFFSTQDSTFIAVETHLFREGAEARERIRHLRENVLKSDSGSCPALPLKIQTTAGDDEERERNNLFSEEI